MLHLLPPHTAPLSYLLDDLGSPSARALALALDVTPRTVQRWHTTGHAPRPAMLALHSVSKWGRSEAETRAYNALALSAAQVRCLTHENGALRAEIDRLAALSCYGSANAPSLQGRRDGNTTGLDQQPQQQGRQDGCPGVPNVSRLAFRVSPVVNLFAQADDRHHDDSRAG